MGQTFIDDAASPRGEIAHARIGVLAGDAPGGPEVEDHHPAAEVGQALAPKQEAYVEPEAEVEEEQPQPVRRPRVEVSNTAKKPDILAATAEKEDYYDIPAFLRRQAN